MGRLLKPVAALLAVLAAVPAAADGPLVWFCPLDPLLRPEVNYGGSPQYMELFQPGAPWEQAASRVNVFKIYPQWATRASDDDLRAQFAELKRRGIALALEWGMLNASDACGRGVEGFGGQNTLNTVRRIQRLGGDLRYIAMDEPIFFGTLYKGANACRWTVEEMAQSAAANIRALRAEFPGVTVGDIEPLPVDETDRGWLDQYAKGIDALQAATGEPLAFFHCDVLWQSDRWPAALEAMRAAAEARGLPFGVIYNGNSSDQSDAAWTGAAEAHMTAYESAADPPGHVIFQSWHAYPKKLLPETDAASFTSLINRYFRTRTQIAAGLWDGAIWGVLAAGDRVPGAEVRLTATPLSGEGVDTEYVLEGVAPAGSRQLVFGIRVNLECGCQGTSDFRLRGFRLESGDTVITRDFSGGLSGWGVSDRSVVSIEDGQLRVRAAAGQTLLVNSAGVPFTAENAPYKLTVKAAVAPASAGSGYFTAIFLGEKELARTRVPIATAEQELGTTTTADDGIFCFSLPALAPLDWLLRLTFPGDAAYWPAKAEVKLSAAGSGPVE